MINNNAIIISVKCFYTIYWGIKFNAVHGKLNNIIIIKTSCYNN